MNPDYNSIYIRDQKTVDEVRTGPIELACKREGICIGIDPAVDVKGPI